jgi:hypothetical protein
VGWLETEMEMDFAALDPKSVLEGGLVQVPGRVELREHAGASYLVAGYSNESPLADAEPESYSRFAKRWGMLGLCQHDLPAGHNPFPYPPPRAMGIGNAVLSFLRAENISLDRRVAGAIGMLEGSSGSSLGSPCFPESQEALQTWQQFAVEAQAMLRIAGRLHRGQLPLPEDWAAVYARSGREAPWWDRSDRPESPAVRFERWKLAEVVTEWLRLGNVRPQFEWEGRSIRMVLTGQGLFGAIARELAFATGRAEGLASCHECGTFFIPDRKPVTGRRSFCFDCGRRAAQKYAARDYRKQKAARSRKTRKGGRLTVER